MPADDELSVSCGCPVTSSSAMVTDAPAPSTTVSACSDGDSFSIVSETLAIAEGCYLDAGSVSTGQVLYTTSGTDDLGQMWMAPLELSGEGGGSSSTAGDVSGIIGMSLMGAQGMHATVVQPR